MGLALSGPALALDLALPVDCSPGLDCYVQNYVDHDPGPGVRDAACGPLTYDGHDGTDFALPTFADLSRQVAVLAAADGIVRAVRDGAPDQAQGQPGAPDVTGAECGNGVLIDHPGGWETQYCHMARGSVRVGPGDSVTAGTQLGEIGLSGQTEFPHLHLTLRHDGATVDPFAPESAGACGGGDPLWSVPLAFDPSGITAAGWATAVPEYAEVRAGTADRPIARDAPALVLWALMFGGQAGDRVRLTVTGPGGVVVDHSQDIDGNTALFFRAAGLVAPARGFPPGAYAGDIDLIRAGQVIEHHDIALTIAP